MYNCQICNKFYYKRQSLIQHIIKYHKILIYDYWLQYDKCKLECKICKNIISRKKYKSSHQHLCDSKYCRKVVGRITFYNIKSDPFSVYNPERWLIYLNHNSEKVIYILNYLKHFTLYFYNYDYLNLFKKLGLENEFYGLLTRIKNQEISLTLLKKYNNVQSIKRWQVLGFSDEISSRITSNFKTDKQNFIYRHSTFEWNDYINKISGHDSTTHQNWKYYRKHTNYNDNEIHEIFKKKFSRNRDWFINKHGDYEGNKKYNLMIERRKKSFSLEGNIQKYGEEEGQKRYTEIIQKKTNWIPNIQSSISMKFISSLHLFLNKRYETEFPVGCYICDFYIPDLKVVIEFFGDYWHANPFTDIRNFEDCKSINLSDNYRNEYLLNNPLVKKLLVVWERSFINIPDIVVQNSISFLIDPNCCYLELNYDKKKLVDKREL